MGCLTIKISVDKRRRPGPILLPCFVVKRHWPWLISLQYFLIDKWRWPGSILLPCFVVKRHWPELVLLQCFCG